VLRAAREALALAGFKRGTLRHADAARQQRATCGKALRRGQRGAGVRYAQAWWVALVDCGASRVAAV